MYKPVLLLWDDFMGHWTPEVTQYASTINVVLLKVAASATSVCQPADVAWNKPLKENMRKSWVRDLRNQLSHHKPAAPFKLSPPTRTVICKWVLDAWMSLSPNTIESGFKRAKIMPCQTEIDTDVVLALERLHLADAGVDVDEDVVGDEDREASP